MAGKTNKYQPPFTVTARLLRLAAEIGEAVGQLSTYGGEAAALRLRRLNRIRTIQGSLAIEGNTLNEEQITALLDGKRVLAPPREILEAQNAIAVYDRLENWSPVNETDLLRAHALLMAGLVDAPGHYRTGGVGVVAGDKVLHMAPPAKRIPVLMEQLFGWLNATDDHPLVSSSVFHYEFEFIHPFADGNGRMGRLWQTLLLSRWNPIFARIPVESLIHQRQDAYYAAIRESTRQGDSASFITFMLEAIRDAVALATPQDRPHVSPQVMRLLKALTGEMTREELQRALRLQDRKSFRQRYLEPAMAEGLVVMVVPDKPNSRNQRYRLTNKGKNFLRNEPRIRPNAARRTN